MNYKNFGNKNYQMYKIRKNSFRSKQHNMALPKAKELSMYEAKMALMFHCNSMTKTTVVIFRL